MKYIKYALVLLLLGFFMEAGATHIIGGDMQYRCLGNNRYEVTLYFLRDCENANPEADNDDPAVVYIYDENYNPVETVGEDGIKDGILLMDYPGSDTLFNIATNPCFSTAGDLCVEKTVYKDTLTLPYKEGGYRLAYQRCCRNVILQNIMEPLNTGGTYETYITETALETCNSGPSLDYFPDLYTCVNEEFNFNQSFIDEEGDLVVYSLCTPNAGASMENPNPSADTTGHPQAPFPLVEWAIPYSTEDMMNNPADPVEISNNGILSGTATQTGTYLVGFCIEEYRNGKLLSRSNRDFEITILPCEEVPRADIGLPGVICDGKTVDFINNSTNASSYEWFFDLRDTSLTSTEENPTYTYPDTGCYEIMLVVTEDSICYDTARQTLCVYEDSIIPEFNYENIGGCTDSSTIRFYNQSTDSISSIESAAWEIQYNNDTIALNGDTVSYTFLEEGSADVTLTVTAANGCVKTLKEEDIPINFLSLDIVGDSLSICLGEETPLLTNGNPDYDYSYDPEAGLDLSDPTNPIASPDTNTSYIISVTDGICTTTDSVYVEVRGQNFSIIDLSDSCSIEKIFTTNNTTHSNIKWAVDPDFETVLGTEDTFRIDVPFDTTVYVMVQDTQLNCTLTQSIDISHAGLNLAYPDTIMLCIGQEQEFSLDNLDPDDNYNVEWESNPIITSDLDQSTITLLGTELGEDAIIFFAEAENGCTLMDTIGIIVNDTINADFAFANECGSLTVEFTNQSGVDDGSWDFGDGGSSDETNPTYTYDEPGTYEVTLTLNDGCSSSATKEITIDEFDLDIPDQQVSCFGESVQLNPGGDESLNYSWSPSEGLDDTTSFNPTASVTEDMSYSVTITDPDSDCRTIDTVSVAVVDTFSIMVSEDIQQCTESAVTIEASSSQGSITWYDDMNNVVGTGMSIEVIPGQSDYYIARAAVMGCTVEDTVFVELIDFDGLLTATADPDTIDFGEESQLNVDGGTADYTYNWEPSGSLSDPTIQNPVAKPKETTEYCVTVTDNNDCETVECVTVVVRDAPCQPPFVFMPNAFSPNGDGKNDVLYVRGEPITELHLIIYNRWGEKVFETNNPAQGWDGKDQDGTEMQDDVYGYYFEAVCGNQGRYEEKGNVSLIR